MKLGGMQPYFFPYIGYFSLIKHTDLWVIADNVQFISKGWINRNRILKTKIGEIDYINVPLKKFSHRTPIKNVLIDNEKNWKTKILRQLMIYSKAPYYKEVIALLNEIFDFETSSISEFNIHSIKSICEYLGIEFNYVVFSNIENFDCDNVKEADEWALEMCKFFNATEYVNPPGGKTFYSRDKYLKNNIKLTFLTPILKEYETFSPSFVPGLSIIDVMLWNSKEEVLNIIDNYTLD
ncbi:WbqC family protein [Cetobacterium sp. 8H]|uniref:WbqC family protein n=1 Tax=Cetobacterium sp. 8H TaxID=2759681 RepID=UPI00163B6A8A|nr:WbqC family protein [Cetobacterium sp. 8H]MBC2850870.1 WbqC family protein [Cetobacterium sp. 8H]